MEWNGNKPEVADYRNNVEVVPVVSVIMEAAVVPCCGHDCVKVECG